MTPDPRYKILVIDDSKTVRQSAELFLKQGGHEVVLAEDGFDALSKVSDHQPDLIFCDICLLYTSPSPRDRTRSRMPSSA